MRIKIGGTARIAHGPPITENSVKIPYKSIRVGQGMVGRESNLQNLSKELGVGPRRRVRW
jgi:hypothetical protein